jgi:hypothetical protein
MSAQSLVRHLNFPRKQSRANHHSSYSSPTFPLPNECSHTLRNRSLVHISVAGHLIFLLFIILKYWGNNTHFFSSSSFRFLYFPVSSSHIFSSALCSHLPFQLGSSFGMRGKVLQPLVAISEITVCW